jgi:hypothetical protein
VVACDDCDVARFITFNAVRLRTFGQHRKKLGL